MTLKELKQFTEDYFGVSIDPVDRKGHKIKARFLFYHTAYKMFPRETLVSLGNFLGQDHATVLYALKELPNIVAFDKRFAKMVEGYNLMLKKTDHLSNFELDDYDKLKATKQAYLDLSAKAKIKEQKEIIRKQKNAIKLLKHRLSYYENMCGL